jgi:hypothetical protein
MLSTLRHYLEMALKKAGVVLDGDMPVELAGLDASVAEWEDNVHRTDALERRLKAIEDKLKMGHPRDPALRTGT